MSKIKISPDLTLPADAVTQTFGILAMKRMGKSYTARRFAEQLLKASLQTVIVDPKGDWWGIRSSADGKQAGLSIVIFGGEHGDVPLEPNGGEIVAKLIVEERVSALLDLSLLRKAQVATFMTAFLETLYRLKAREAYRTPVMLVIDEADIVAPQKPYHGEERMLGAAEDIVRRGGQRGIGCTMITQRAAVINKNVLTQVQVLVVLRTIGKKDRDALDEWIEVHGSPEERKELMESVASLPKGDAWFWSPGWPTAEGIFLRTHVSPIETFDSGATPEAGKKPLAPKMLADVDLEAVRRQMADTVERAKADDPKALRADLANARAEIGKLQARPPSPSRGVEKIIEKRVEVPVLTEKDIKRYEAACERMQKALDKHLAELAPYQARIVDANAKIMSKMAAAMKQAHVPLPLAVAHPAPVRAAAPARAPRAPKASSGGESPVVSGPQHRILDALAWFEALGIAQPSRTAIAFVAGVRPSSGSYGNNLGALRSGGYIDYPRTGDVALTDEGRALAAPPAVAPTAEAIQQMVKQLVSGPQAAILGVLIDNYPSPVERAALAEAVGVAPTSGSYGNNLGALRTLGVLDYPASGLVVATALLFPTRAAA